MRRRWASSLAGARDHRHRQVADDREMPLRQPKMGCVLAVARVLADVVGTDDAGAAEGRLEQLRVARHGELGELLARRARYGVERVAFAILVEHLVEERAE